MDKEWNKFALRPVRNLKEIRWLVLSWHIRAGVAKSVYCLTTEWATGVRSPAEAKNFSSSLCVQTRSEAHPVSNPMGTGGPFPGVKARPGSDADHSPHLSSRSWMSRSYTSSPSNAFVACGGQLWLSQFRMNGVWILTYMFHCSVLLKARVVSSKRSHITSM
jgi:hypothetical protein